jgi:pectate lyase
MYNFLRTKGFSVEDIIAVVRSQKKGHLVGATEFATENADLSITLHHNYYFNFQDRIPRLRGGNAHAYNIYVNNTEALAARRLRDQRVAAMNATDAAKLSGSSPTYKFAVTLNGAISTEDGAVLLEKSHLVDVTSPVRNNQTDPANPAYTGKIRALDTIYTLDASTFRGGSEDAGSPLAPVPAPVKPFSFNGFVTLPYAYEVDDPSTIAPILSGNQGPGSGIVFWAKTNWLKNSY